MHVGQRLTPMGILIVFIVCGYRCRRFEFDVYECFSNRIKYSGNCGKKQFLFIGFHKTYRRSLLLRQISRQNEISTFLQCIKWIVVTRSLIAQKYFIPFLTSVTQIRIPHKIALELGDEKLIKIMVPYLCSHKFGSGHWRFSGVRVGEDWVQSARLKRWNSWAAVFILLGSIWQTHLFSSPSSAFAWPKFDHRRRIENGKTWSIDVLHLNLSTSIWRCGV